MQDMKNEYGQRYKMVPPEGGWGYVVCAGVSIIFIAGTAHKAVFGLIYNDFLDELGAGTGVVTVVFGVYEMSIALSGFLTTIILKKLSVRQVAVIGAMIYTFASVLAIFVTSTNQLVITNGFLQGTGLGILSSASYTSLNSYFTKKRVLYLGLCKTCLAMTSVIYPLITKSMMIEYGFRGTLAILCAISMNSILGALTLQPVQWHMMRKYEFSEEMKLLPKYETLNEEKNSNLENDRDRHTHHKNSQRYSFVKRQSAPALFDRKGFIEIKKHRKYSDINDLESLPILKKDVKSIVVVSRRNRRNKGDIWQTVYNLLDLTLLKDLVYVNIVIGIALTFFSNKTFFVLEPLFLDKMNLTKAQIAYIMAVGSATDMLVRLLFALSGIFIRINSRYIFYTGAFLQIIFKITIVQFTSYIPLMILTAILGALKSLIFITQPIVIADYVPIEKYPSAYGFYMLLDGTISIIIGPLIGYVRDYTGSYAVAYSMCAVCNLCCVVPWTIEAVMKNLKRKISATHTL